MPPENNKIYCLSFGVRTAQHIDIVPLSFLSCEYVYILLKLCVSIAQCIEVGDRLMSSPVTSIVIICAHWPNKTILNGSCQCDGHNKQNKRQTTQRKGKTMTTTLSMAMRIPNIKYHYRVLALFGGYFFFSVICSNEFFCDGFCWYCVKHIFRLSFVPFGYLFQIPHYLFYLLLAFNAMHVHQSPLCQFLIFVLLFERYRNHKNYLYWQWLCMCEK